jgi:hypothetical protein
MLTKDDKQRTYKHNFDHTSLNLLKRMDNPNKKKHRLCQSCIENGLKEFEMHFN